jgi:preprotein translocase subunit SecF
MIRFFDKADYNILGHRKVAFGVALAFMLPGLVLLAIRGLNESIDFTGGVLLQIEAGDESVTTATVRAALDRAGLSAADITTAGASNQFTVRTRLQAQGGGAVAEGTTQQTREAVDAALRDAFGEGSYSIVLAETVGPKVSGELRRLAVLAILMGFGAIFIYLSFRMEWRFGVAAVLATVHDILSTMAFVSYLHLEVSVIMVAALLTIVGYSLNDTIVTFDRVRENLRRFRRDRLFDLLNRSINETLPRTVLTSGTTLAATVALIVLGPPVLRPFAMVITFGIITGTFSSIFIASPILLAVEQKWPGEDARGARAMTPRTPTAADKPQQSVKAKGDKYPVGQNR